MDPIDRNDDLELLAALADGRLSGAERERAIKLLADSDEALELFANTLRDQPAVAPVATVVPITSARGWRWRQWKVVVPAAVAAALAFVVPRLAQLGGSGALANQFAMELVRDPRFAGGLRAGWEQPVWAVTRGIDLPRETPQAGSPAESRLAFRLGVRSVDLGIALQRGDTAIADSMANEMIETLRGIGFSELVATRYADLKSGLATDPLARSIDRASQNERELRELLHSPAFVFGQWARAANLAAQTGDRSFFEADHGTRFIRAAMPEGSLSQDDEKALRSIDERVTRGLDDGALAEIHNSLQEVIRQRAR